MPACCKRAYSAVNPEKLSTFTLGRWDVTVLINSTRSSWGKRPDFLLLISTATTTSSKM
ncbi:hypothetical protein D3C72_2588870 [compost metagenome]